MCLLLHYKTLLQTKFMLHVTPTITKTATLTRNFIRNISSPTSDINIWATSLSFASPESDFTAEKTRNNLVDHMAQNEQDLSRLVHSLSFAQAESDFTSLLFTEDMKEQLANVVIKEEVKEFAPLPTTLYDALQASDEARVITEVAPPFRISNINEAWEHLCGYRKDECYGETLGMLQGPETDKSAITALMNQLGRGETAGVILTNYKKDGRKFRNRLTVGPLYGDVDGKNTDQITHLIGIVQEIQDLGTGNQSIRI